MQSAPCILIVTAAICSVSQTPALADECIVAGSATTFGADMNGTFEVDAGEACHYAFRLSGAVESSKVLTPAQNGSVRMLDLSSFEYRANPGFRGRDSFAIEATGESQRGRGRSVLNMTVLVK